MGGSFLRQWPNGPYTEHYAPVPIYEGVNAISSGAGYLLAIDSNGEVLAWGSNTRGRLGNGLVLNNDFTFRSYYDAPTKVLNIDNVISVAAGYNSSFAVDSYGVVWAWGDNQSGELGDGTKTTRNSPVKVLGFDKNEEIEEDDPPYEEDNPLYHGPIGQAQPSSGEILSLVEDPVDVITGNLTWYYTDLELYGAQRLSFMRHYNSQLKQARSIGYGWRHSFDYSMEESDGNVIITVPNGYTYSFAVNSNGTFTPPPNSNVSLEKTATGYTFVLYDKTRYLFNYDKNLTQIIDINENVTSFTYTNGLLTRADNRSGSMYLAYTNDRITRIWDDNGREVSFGYDLNGDLVKFINADGDSLDYIYDDSHNLLKVSDFNGNTYMNNTFQDGQVVEQYLADQGTSYFEYDPDNRRNVYTDAMGTQAVYYYDQNYKITHIEDDGGNRSQQFVDGQLISSTDYAGNTTKYEYDARGNRTRIIYPDGTIERYEYNDKNLVTLFVDGNGFETAFAYDTKGNMTSITDAKGNIRRFAYDLDNNLTSYTDANGVVTTYTYDAKGNRTLEKGALGNTTMYRYDSIGRLASQTTPMGEPISYEYSLAGKLLRITDPQANKQTFKVNGNGFNTSVTNFGGNTVSTAYDLMNNPVSITYPEGNIVSYRYNETGKLSELTDPLGNKTIYTYDKKGRLAATEDPLGNAWGYGYTLNGQIEKTTDPYGNEASIEYDAMGQVKKTTNARRAETGYRYDNAGRLVSMIDAIGNEIGVVYDKNSNIIEQTDKNGSTWENEYDAENRLIKSIGPLGNETVYEYDALGRLVQMTSPEGAVYKIAYDENGRPIQLTDPLNNVSENIYDPLGNLVRCNNPDKTSVSFGYDKNGLLLSATDEEGRTTSYTYNKNGQVLTITDPKGGVTSYKYDDNGRITSVTNAIGGVISYIYDKNGNIRVVTDTNGGITVYEYDRLNRVSAMFNPMSGRKTFKYDANSNIAEIKDARGYVTSFEYDLLDRMIGYTNADGNRFSVTYDNNGNVMTVGSPNGITERTYNALNRVTSFKDVNGNKIQYGYDSDGRLTSIAYPTGEVVRYTYNAAGQLTEVLDYNNRKTSYRYDQNGRLVETVRPDGSVETIEYNKAGQVIEKKDVKDDTLINHYMYEYDVNGNITAEISPLEMGVPEPKVTSMAYDANNRLITYNGRTIQYDANGNMTNGPLDGGFVRFEYDKQNRLVKAGDTAYAYDGEGNRISISKNGEKTTLITSPSGELSDLLMTVHPDGSRTLYVYGLGLISQETVEADTVTKVDYRLFHYDYRGSTTALTDITGAVTDRNTYSAFGNVEKRTGDTDTVFLYVGQFGIQTDENGLYYMRNRYYNPEISRFVNEDPIGDGLNWYIYANNNPIRYIDPRGEMPEWVSDFGSGAKDSFIGYYKQTGEVLIYPFTSTADLLTGAREQDAFDHLPLSTGPFLRRDYMLLEAESAREQDVFDILPPSLSTSIRRDYNLAKKIRCKDAYGAGEIIGETAGEASLTLALYGIGKGATGGRRASAIKGEGYKSIHPSEQKMWQLGDHYNKHGRGMGYSSKAAYDAAAKKFAVDMQSHPEAKIFEGQWNGRGQLNGATQRAIINNGKTIIIDSNSGQIIDFFNGTDISGIINQIQLK